MQEKNISSQSGKLLSYFHNRGIRCFNFTDAYQAMSEMKFGTVRELLSEVTEIFKTLSPETTIKVI